MRWSAKRDDTERGIVSALERAGWTVVRMSDKGLPDLLCMRRGVVRFLECKSPGGTLTPAQTAAFQRFAGALVTVHVVRTPEEALMAVGAPVEGVLQPVLDMRRLHDHMERTAQAGPLTIHVHPGSVVGKAIRAEVEAKGHVDVTDEQIIGHVVTPAFQREQTKAVVPRRKKT